MLGFGIHKKQNTRVAGRSGLYLLGRIQKTQAKF